ncbi:hypothetical protein GF358_00010 [Candidatus Woesearchaeota archaeon]|nr:hypothetical protein [Candidatus Woesearchaeota archaeon]
MRQDLQNRLTIRPYMWKKVNRIEADLPRIDFLEQTELKHNLRYRAYSENNEPKIGFKQK